MDDDGQFDFLYDMLNTSTSSSREVKKLRDRSEMLARVASRALDMIKDSGHTDLKTKVFSDTETTKWWKTHAAEIRAANERREKELAKQAEITEAKATAFAKLSDEELRAFGIKRPVVKTPAEPKRKPGRPRKDASVSTQAV